MAIYDPTKRPADSFDTHTHLNDEAFWHDVAAYWARAREYRVVEMNVVGYDTVGNCLLYTSDAADEEDSVDLGGRRISKKKKKNKRRKKQKNELGQMWHKIWSL